MYLIMTVFALHQTVNISLHLIPSRAVQIDHDPLFDPEDPPVREGVVSFMVTFERPVADRPIIGRGAVLPDDQDIVVPIFVP